MGIRVRVIASRRNAMPSRRVWSIADEVNWVYSAKERGFQNPQISGVDAERGKGAGQSSDGELYLTRGE